MKKLSEYVKTAESAEILGVSQTTLRKWSESGKIPTKRNPMNGYRLFLKKDLENFLRDVEATDEKPKNRKRA